MAPLLPYGMPPNGPIIAPWYVLLNGPIAALWHAPNSPIIALWHAPKWPHYYSILCPQIALLLLYDIYS